MKIFTSVLLMLSIVFVQTSCEENYANPAPLQKQNNDLLPKEEDMSNPLANLIAFTKESEAEWQKTKAKIFDTYSYSINFTSGLAPSSKTIISITKGQITSREYRSDTLSELPGENWKETGEKIGSHKGGASPAVTLDSLYLKCLGIVLKRNPRSADFTVSTFADGTLKSCYSWECGTVDDAANGIEISSIIYSGFVENKNQEKVMQYKGCRQ